VTKPTATDRESLNKRLQ